MTELRFTKMHGLGNDFVVLDARSASFTIDEAAARRLSDRKRGIGCDQLIVIEPGKNELADAFMRIYNADGSEVEACGNATRCIAHVLMRETGKRHAIIETVVGLLDAEVADGGNICVDMGQARLDWREIPLAEPCDTLHVDLPGSPLTDGVAVNMGNPHIVFFVEDIEAVNLATIGREIETHAMFPDFVNVSVAEVVRPDEIKLRVWERGVGITEACGTAACATLVAAARRGLTDRKADIHLAGGMLTIEWLPDNNVLMTGPAATSFSGTVDQSLLG